MRVKNANICSRMSSNLPVVQNDVDPHEQEREETRRKFYENYKPFHAYVFETDEGILDEEGQMTYWPWVLRNSGASGLNASAAAAAPMMSQEQARNQRLAALARRGVAVGGTRKFRRRPVHRSKRVRR
jgi:hypothetical protein